MNYNDAIKKMTSLLILQCIVIASHSQVNSAFLNKAQKNVYFDNLTAKNIVGYIVFKIKINQHGLIDSEGKWKELTRYMNDVDNGFELVPWYFSRIKLIDEAKKASV